MIVNELSSLADQNKFFDMIPSVLYKYRDWNNCYHKRIIELNKIWFSRPNNLNDPYDCQLPFIVDAEEIRSQAFLNSLIKEPSKGYEECVKKWEEIKISPSEYFAQRSPILLNEYLKFGVLSLCATPENFLLWSHYANAHKGFCVGFDTRSLIFKSEAHLDKVKYQSDFPVFKFLADMNEELTKALTTKHIQWEYEMEWRLTKMNLAGQEIMLNPNTITEVHFGVRMDKEEKRAIVDILKERSSDVRFYQMRLSNDKFDVESEQVEL